MTHAVNAIKEFQENQRCMNLIIFVCSLTDQRRTLLLNMLQPIFLQCRNLFFKSIITCVIPVNIIQCQTCCLHLQTIFTEENRGLKERFVTCSNNNHLKLSSKTSEHVVDHNTCTSNVDVAAEKLQIL